VRAVIEKLRRHGFAADEIRRFIEAELNLDSEEVRDGH
jgi:hypothetical protein